MRSAAALGIVSFFLFGAVANAQFVPSGNISIGYSYVRADLSTSRPLSPSFSTSNFNGWEGALELKFIPWIGGVADFGGNYGTPLVTPPCESILSQPCGPFDDRNRGSLLTAVLILSSFQGAGPRCRLAGLRAGSRPET